MLGVADVFGVLGTDRVRALCGIVAHGSDGTAPDVLGKASCIISKACQDGCVNGVADIEALARARLRSMRTTLGYSLDELGRLTNLSPSTISRVETGRRALSLDVLVPLANALQMSFDVLFEVPDDDDVVIRPVAHSSGTRTTWPLSRPDGRTVAMKMRLEPSGTPPSQRVHPGHDWFLVLEGRVRLWLGDRRIDVDAGEAAEFATMVPHAFTALDGPAELIMVFDRDGQRAHVHQ
ncbi:cupin domain-containing protein [Streptomyces spongiicola]|uniref:Cupin domain-containing protein n=1 Tax=Streptomyces spongiicola TaxID=1690221 RepID=A0A388T1F6_9ACTN|nr:cupin domain-containing protein [Streptomyces spongiicola]